MNLGSNVQSTLTKKAIFEDLKQKAETLKTLYYNQEESQRDDNLRQAYNSLCDVLDNLYGSLKRSASAEELHTGWEVIQ